MSNVVEVTEDRSQNWLASARRSLDTEANGLAALIEALDGELGESFSAAIDLLRHASGNVIFSGIGKSGHIARKAAATFASTGTRAMFVHAAEASHGDLGMVSPEDVIIMLSNSGENAELKDIVAYSRRFAVPLIAMTGNAGSALGKAADVVLKLPRAAEACPNGLAPTTSTTMQIALGDALAIALLDDRGFTAAEFQKFHPGGRLGAALAHVRDVMHGGDRLPLAAKDTVMSDALLTMTAKSLGCLGVIDDDGRLAGVITDGDLRRHMQPDLLKRTAGEIMTNDPKTVTPDTLASAAMETLNSMNITILFVVENQRPVGVIHVHDLLQLGVR
ncbi:MAG: KpsF/GutQ family sugar-phosphate isomerase [Hyphomicrobiales bacterium]|nr:KpsF/GutQ family sugar-phosphate isomerase [Hyphomicrobiales bacterium]